MKTFARKIIEHYKPWRQPKISSNGTMGVSDFACYLIRSYDGTHANAYQAFYPNSGTVLTYLSLKVSTMYVYFESKNPLIIKKLSFYVPMNGTQNNYNGGWCQNVYLHGKNKQGEWEQIGYIAGGANMANKTHTMTLTNNKKKYKQYRLQASTKGTGHNDELEISSIRIEAMENTTVIRTFCKAIKEKTADSVIYKMIKGDK